MNPHPHPQTSTAFPLPQLALSQYITTGSLPDWEQLPSGCKRELALSLASLLLRLPEIQGLQEVGDDPQL